MRLLAFVAFAAAAAAALAPAPASARPYGAAAFFADAVAPVRDLVHESLAAVASRAAATAGAAPRAKCNTTACVQQCFEPVRNFSDPCVQLNSTSGVSGNPDVFGPWSATERGVLDRLCGCRDSYVQYFRRISDFYECVGAELNLDPLVEYLDNVLDEFACLKNGDEYCPVLFNRAARFGGFRPFLDAEEGCESGRDVVDYLGCCTRALRDFLNTPPVDWDAVYSPPTNTTGPKLAARAKTAAPSTSPGPRPRGAHWPLRRGTGGIGRLAREALARSPARALIVNASVPVPVQYDGSAPVTPEPGAEILGRRFNGSDVDAALARCNLTADDIDECLEPGDTETYTVVTVRVNASLNDTLPDDSARTRFAVAIRRDLARATGIFPWNFQVVSISQDFVVLIRVRGDDAKDAVDDALESDAGVQLNHTATEIPFFAGRSLNTDSASTDTEDVEAPSTGTEDGDDDDDDDDDDDHGDSSPAPAAVPGLAVFAVAAVLAAVL